MDYPVAEGRILYLHLFHGALAIQGEPLQAGDGATLTQADAVQLQAQTDAEALLFDLPSLVREASLQMLNAKGDSR